MCLQRAMGQLAGGHPEPARPPSRCAALQPLLPRPCGPQCALLPSCTIAARNILQQCRMLEGASSALQSSALRQQCGLMQGRSGGGMQHWELWYSWRRSCTASGAWASCGRACRCPQTASSGSSRCSIQLSACTLQATPLAGTPSVLHASAYHCYTYIACRNMHCAEAALVAWYLALMMLLIAFNGSKSGFFREGVLWAEEF